VTRDIVWPVSARLGADSVTVVADFPVDMRDYGIKPREVRDRADGACRAGPRAVTFVKT